MFASAVPPRPTFSSGAGEEQLKMDPARVLAGERPRGRALRGLGRRMAGRRTDVAPPPFRKSRTPGVLVSLPLSQILDEVSHLTLTKGLI